MVDQTQSDPPVSFQFDWSEQAPESLRPLSPLQNAADWSTWAAYLASRPAVGIVEAPPGRAHTPGSAKRWLATDPATDVAAAKRSLDWLSRLPALAGRFLPALWWQLLERLREEAIRAQNIPPEDYPLVHPMLAAELPLTLGRLFPEIQGSRELLSLGLHGLAAGMEAMLDGEGMPHARYLPLLRPLLACWTRCRAVSSPEAQWPGEALEQYRLLVRNALRLTRPDGVQALSPFPPSPEETWNPKLFAAAVPLAGEDQQRLAAMLLPRGAGAAGGAGAKTPPDEAAKLPDPAVHSEWAGMAVLRGDWAWTAPQLTVDYHRGGLAIELRRGRDLLLLGSCGIEIRRNGLPVAPPEEWDSVGWQSDEHVDYLELDGECAGGLHIQRQFVLTRTDGLLWIADSVLCDRPGDIDYAAGLPLGPDIAFQKAPETHEGRLVWRGKTGSSPSPDAESANAKPLARVIPLGLPEWQSDSRPGKLEQAERSLVVRQSARQLRALHVPLVIDLNSRRLSKPLTWRQLTVAENLQAVPGDVAVGYRVQLGKEQWLVYRSLAPWSNRTVLGQNIVCEMLLARFKNGQAEALLEIEGSPGD